MNKKYLFSISLLISLLIILIPIAVATELETYDKLVLKTKEQKINLYQNPGDEEHLSDPGQACVEQHKETSSFADSLDNSVISTLEKIASILFAICITMSAIDLAISAVAMGIGMISGDFCCTPPMMVCPGPCGAPCTAMAGVYKGWSTIYSFVRPLCCFVNCGWCMGAKTGETCWGLPFGLEKFALPSYIPDLGISAGLTREGERKGGIGQFGLSPYDNIYLAIACLCPIAIIFNMRKLKTIYDVYDCCIQEACENGLSTESCERQLDEATCMYWEGSLYSMLAKILLSLILSLITKELFKNLIKDTFLEGIIMCAYAVFKLTEIPKVIEGVTSAWDYMDSWGKPDCEDLGFEDVKDEIQYDWIDLTIVDQNKDGIYDYYAKLGKEDISATIVSDDDAFEWVSSDYDDEHRYYYNDKGKVVGRYEFKTKKYEKFDSPIDPASVAAPQSPTAPIPPTSVVSNDNAFEWRSSDHDDEYRYYYNDKGKVVGRYDFDTEEYEKFDKPVDRAYASSPPSVTIPTSIVSNDGVFEWSSSDHDNKYRYYYNDDGKVVGRYNFNTEEYEKFDSPIDKKYASAPSSVPPKKGPIKSLKTGLKQDYENEAVKIVMYEMIWTLFDATLEEKVDDWIEDKCEEDYEASYPPSDTPSESGGPAACEDTGNNVYNGQFISKIQLGKSCKYEVSYALAACDHTIDFIVYLSDPGWRQNIEEGSLELGQSISRNKIITGICTFQRICIIIKGETTECYPPLP